MPAAQMHKLLVISSTKRIFLARPESYEQYKIFQQLGDRAFRAYARLTRIRTSMRERGRQILNEYPIELPNTSFIFTTAPGAHRG